MTEFHAWFSSAGMPECRNAFNSVIIIMIMTFRHSGIPAVKNRTQIDFVIMAFRQSGIPAGKTQFQIQIMADFQSGIPAERARHSGIASSMK